MDLEVWIEGQDEPISVRADQRDMAAFELEYRIGTMKAMDDMPMVFFRFIGWSACRRTGKIPDPHITREAWLDNVIGVEPIEDEEGEVFSGSDPTNAAP